MHFFAPRPSIARTHPCRMCSTNTYYTSTILRRPDFWCCPPVTRRGRSGGHSTSRRCTGWVSSLRAYHWPTIGLRIVNDRVSGKLMKVTRSQMTGWVIGSRMWKGCCEVLISTTAVLPENVSSIVKHKHSSSVCIAAVCVSLASVVVFNNFSFQRTTRTQTADSYLTRRWHVALALCNSLFAWHRALCAHAGMNACAYVCFETNDRSGREGVTSSTGA